MYIFITEMAPKKLQFTVGATALVFSVVSASIPISLYFYLGGNNWKEIYIIMIITSPLAFLLSFFLPESPRYLYEK